MEVTPYILVGGKSRRMGRNKSLINFRGKTVLARLMEICINSTGQEATLVGDGNWLNQQGSIVLPDFKPDCGPVGGLISALDHCPSNWALVLAGDLPLLDIVDVNKLIAAVKPGDNVITLSNDGQIEPLAAIYHKSTLPFWLERMNRDDFSLKPGIRELRVKTVETVNSEALFNLNSIEDLSALKKKT